MLHHCWRKGGFPRLNNGRKFLLTCFLLIYLLVMIAITWKFVMEILKYSKVKLDKKKSTCFCAFACYLFLPYGVTSFLPQFLKLVSEILYHSPSLVHLWVYGYSLMKTSLVCFLPFVFFHMFVVLMLI